MVNTERNRGGAARMASTLAKTINASGAAKATLYHCEDRTSSNNAEGLKRIGSRQLNALLARLGGSQWVFDFGVAAEILRRSRKADVLHLHNLHGYYLDYKYLIKRWGERPIVWTWHDMWGATGRCGSGYDCKLWQSGCQKCPDLSLYPAAWIDRAHYEHQSKEDLLLSLQQLQIVAPSPWIASIARQRGFANSRIHVIPNPVDTNCFAPSNINNARAGLDLPLNSRIAMFIASDCSDPRKGYQDFAKTVLGSDILGIAIGSPPKVADKRILHLGRISDPKVLSLYYNAADVMIIPSYADNYPNTVLEALACGTPVIGYETGGIPEQLTMPLCELVKTGDTNALGNVVANMRRKTETDTASISSIASKRWSQPAVCAQYLATYLNNPLNDNVSA